MLEHRDDLLSPALEMPTMVSDRVITRCTTLASSSAVPWLFVDRRRVMVGAAFTT